MLPSGSLSARLGESMKLNHSLPGPVTAGGLRKAQLWSRKSSSPAGPVPLGTALAMRLLVATCYCPRAACPGSGDAAPSTQAMGSKGNRLWGFQLPPPSSFVGAVSSQQASLSILLLHITPHLHDVRNTLHSDGTTHNKSNKQQAAM